MFAHAAQQAAVVAALTAVMSCPGLKKFVFGSDQHCGCCIEADADAAAAPTKQIT